jgi:hypothetical protein
MPMLPQSIMHRLISLRRRERGLRLLWGAARVLSVVLVLLGLCCLTDWLIDRATETPTSLRLALTGLQVVVAAVVVYFFLLRPLRHQPTDGELALWVERAEPQLRDRLISAVQLNRTGAMTQGMSADLIAQVTQEAEKQIAAVDFGKVIDRRRLGWSLLVLVPLALGCIVIALVCPTTMAALLVRQLGVDREVPRSLRLENETAETWPSGDAVELTIRAEGPALSPELRGKVRISPEDLPAEEYPLEWQAGREDGSATYVARVPPSSVSFAYRAWLGDSRMGRPGQVHFEPRPALVEQRAWVVLPAYYGLRSNGEPYVAEQTKGDVAGLAGSQVLVLASVNKPITRATLEILGSAIPGGTESVTRTVSMKVSATPANSKGPARAEAAFDLRPGETAYRMRFEDRHGFTNRTMPRRGLAVLPDEPAQVVLLPERFTDPGQRGPLEDTEMEGIPVPVGKSFRVAYRCHSKVPLKEGQLRYRVLSPGVEVKQDEPAWQTLPLREVKESPDAGRFDLNQGVFEKTGPKDQIEFYPLPSPDPEHVPGRRDGGGRFDFQTDKIAKVGDKIEYYVEVVDTRPGATPGRSDIRVKDVVTGTQLTAWLKQKLEESRRLQQLEARQSGMFDKTVPKRPE